MLTRQLKVILVSTKLYTYFYIYLSKYRAVLIVDHMS